MSVWQAHVERAQAEIADGTRPYAASHVVDAEAARPVAERAGVDDPPLVERLAGAGHRLPP